MRRERVVPPPERSASLTPPSPLLAHHASINPILHSPPPIFQGWRGEAQAAAHPSVSVFQYVVSCATRTTLVHKQYTTVACDSHDTQSTTVRYTGTTFVALLIFLRGELSLFTPRLVAGFFFTVFPSSQYPQLQK